MRAPYASLLIAASYGIERAWSVDPLVDVGNTKYEGTALDNGISQWLGVRYASPPTGELRFAAPVDPPENCTTQIANKHGDLCLSTDKSYPSAGHSEDCLFLDVYAPSNATIDSKLPVMFFIQGGGLNALSNSDYNGSQLIEAADFDMVVVTHNYRVGTFGFLASEEIQANGSLNAGFLDQRKAMEWVQDNIANFGGDPGHVVLSGDSSGAQAITVHLTAHGGVDEGLFIGVIAESQSFPPILTVSDAQFEYDAFVERVGCQDEEDTLACLRGQDVAVLQNASITIPYPGREGTPNYLYGAVVDGELIPDFPYNLFSQGRFINVPSVFGDDTDEGTLFTTANLSSTSEMNSFLQDNFPDLNETSLELIDQLYPQGEQIEGYGSYYTAAAAAYGDMRYICPGIFVSQNLLQYNCLTPNWLYHFNVEDPALVAQGVGVPHTVEIYAIWGLSSTGGSFPPSFNTSNANIVPIMQGYWTSFIRTLDPNTYKASDAPEWAAFDGSQRVLLEANSSRMETISDDQMRRCDFLASIAVELKQ